ncbi:4Fe-4S binding protein [Vallitalea pronyensis]|uniref:4Fe-4S binding protein n=1 Tax=Vallitalea pronyensis TaxID=1348613 RepID=A0A8J8MJD2_9FIRM|nr:ATP-binding protein [Vallitalea pronyensis]QUI22654.1 4Fe-4S binding protein [Vallitalea pronyensis]
MQLVIISGKGGTGKTTIAASFAYLSQDSIKCDCDVDASNLHIVLGGEDIEREPYIGAKAASIMPDKCIQCGACERMCRYDAIHDFKINPLKCEGCAACTVVCPANAIELKDEVTGDTLVTQTTRGILSRAHMIPGAEGSGKLVTDVRKKAKKYGTDEDLYLLDGTPGVGCAVMASITGCQGALIVVEPTQSGLSDFKRVLSVVHHFKVHPYICINKYDINERITKEIEAFCQEASIEVIGKIPFDTWVDTSINGLKPIVLYEESAAGHAIRDMWHDLQHKIG